LRCVSNPFFSRPSAAFSTVAASAHDLIFGVVQITQSVNDEVAKRLDVFRKNAHFQSPCFSYWRLPEYPEVAPPTAA
jgi:hypothetical protein